MDGAGDLTMSEGALSLVFAHWGRRDADVGLGAGEDPDAGDGPISRAVSKTKGSAGLIDLTRTPHRRPNRALQEHAAGATSGRVQRLGHRGALKVSALVRPEIGSVAPHGVQDATEFPCERGRGNGASPAGDDARAPGVERGQGARRLGRMAVFRTPLGQQAWRPRDDAPRDRRQATRVYYRNFFSNNRGNFDFGGVYIAEGVNRSLDNHLFHFQESVS